MQDGIKLKLVSNFLDYYDHWFDLEGKEFKRFTAQGMNREEIFQYLEKTSFTVPLYGTVKHLANQNINIKEVVVYLDDMAHCGNGKIKLPLEEALKKYPNFLCSEYIETHPLGIAVSYRHLQIGHKSFFLKYASYNDWRSNCGDGDIELLESHEYKHSDRFKVIKFPYPLCAIDFVYKDGIYWAIDFNTSPGIRGSGIENILKPKEVVDLIKQFIIEHGKE